MKNLVNKNSALVAAGLLLLIVFFPTLRAGYFSDDAVLASRLGMSIPEYYDFAVASVMSWWTEAGRLFWGAALVSALPIYYINDAQFFRAYLFLVNLAAIFLFILLLYRLHGKTIALVFPFIFAPMLQLRDFHDPVLAFAGLYQWAFILVLLVALMLLNYLRTGRLIFCCFAFIVYGCALMVAEVVYALLPFIIFVIWQANGFNLRFWRMSFCLLAVALTVLLIARYGLKVGLERGEVVPLAYVPNYDLVLIIETLAKQLYSTIPLSYSIHRPALGAWGIVSDPFSQDLPVIAYLIAFVSALVTAFGLVSCGVIATRDVHQRCNEFIIVFFYFIFLVVGPASIIIMSPKYQGELTWGAGYLPVYVQYFGLATIGAFAFVRLLAIRSISGAVFRYATILCISLVVAVTGITNWKTVKSHYNTWDVPRLNDIELVESRLFKDLCANRPLLIDGYSPWFTVLKLFKVKANITNAYRDVSIIEGVGCILKVSPPNSDYERIVYGPVVFGKGRVCSVEDTGFIQKSVGGDHFGRAELDCHCKHSLVSTGSVGEWKLFDRGVVQGDSRYSSIPNVCLIMARGWSLQESGHRWAVERVANIGLENPSENTKRLDMRFALSGLQSQNLTISVNGITASKIVLTGGAEPVPVRLSFDLEPGSTIVEFTSDVIPERPKNGDLRLLSFNLSNLIWSEF